MLKYARQKERSLEFGSGKGGLSLALKKAYPEIDVHLLDFSQLAVKYSKDLFDYYGLDGNFHCGSFLTLPYKDAYFDFIHGNTVLEHVKDTEKAVKELTRVLEKGGTGVITVPNSFRRLDGHDLYHFINNIQYYSRTFYPRQLEDLFKNNSCDIIDRFGVSAIFFYPTYPLQFIYRLAQKLFVRNKPIPETGSHCDSSGSISASNESAGISILRRMMRVWGD